MIFNPPVGIQHSGGVAAEEGNALGELATLVKRNDGESATTTGFPIHGEVMRVGLVEGQISVVWEGDSGAGGEGGGPDEP